MADFQIPLRDVRFVRNDVLDFPALYQRLPGYAEATPDLVDAILDELAKFCEGVIAPLYQVGDRGCQWQDGEVTTPPGFKEAYQQYVEGGWAGLTAPEELGGQAMPESLGIILSEMLGTANWSWGMYPGLCHGAKHTLQDHGTDEQRQEFLTKLIEGSWTGTMCLTESHCGSDLGLVKTKAEPQANGSYEITGTKIFISAGEHDMAENILHIVLARLPDAPAGTKGISLFLVPKWLPDEQGQLTQRNALQCGSIEEKMGIHGCATCVMNFDGATGYLLGEVNRGLNHMFTFMNTARIGTALQGVAHSERALQAAVSYAKERQQMRSLKGPQNPQDPADPIIVHPDVRRMLLTIKSFAEGGRMMTQYLGLQADILAQSQDEEELKQAEGRLALLTPIAKAFLTEVGFEAANLGLQVFGGHGYIREWGVEQNVRDSRISMLYEGTTGIQALDLLGRKVLGSGGQLLQDFVDEVKTFCEINKELAGADVWREPLLTHLDEWLTVSLEIGTKAMENPDEVGAASVDYLLYSGYVSMAYLWARAGVAAQKCLAEGSTEVDFYQAKQHTVDFYFKRILPRTRTLVETMRAGAEPLMSMAEQQF